MRLSVCGPKWAFNQTDPSCPHAVQCSSRQPADAIASTRHSRGAASRRRPSSTALQVRRRPPPPSSLPPPPSSLHLQAPTCQRHGAIATGPGLQAQLPSQCQVQCSSLFPPSALLQPEGQHKFRQRLPMLFLRFSNSRMLSTPFFLPSK
jgi:hypothetical protein